MNNTQRPPKRGTVIVPVVTLEKVPVPTDRERDEVVASLKQTEADVAAGKVKPFNRESFKKRFLSICRG